MLLQEQMKQDIFSYNERAKMLAKMSETRRCFMQTDSFL